ncbi:E3 ubiquitin-protein ligase ZNF598 isoform X2 [Brachyhypopomus gauderio]|uniref:E3 ubiquitin-protein ligase ZNF598 isoform X2 n=1 Tax=Brachyhypopomus gauderio TaxID=698409 RepID=UPI0040434DE2
MESTMKRDTENVCVLCCQDVDIFAVGKCDHPVCYRCSTKMRVLCDQKYCAVCREELDKVIFVRKLRPFTALPYHDYQLEKKYDIYFADGKIFAQFRKILLSECPQCPEPKVFSKFEELEQHMRKQHELFCCKLCAKHLKIFSYERKWYNRKDLARHRTQGDPDDTSHRGHPLCKFCDDRYLDNDELLKHLRRDHYFCHFCDADGAQEYYSDYRYLSEHFRESHYLCEEGRCISEQFTHAFRTEIDYKAHKAAAHSKSRAEARQNRQIDIQFNYAPRQQRRNDGFVGGEDYEEVDRFNRAGRSGRVRAPGLQQNVRSWRYNREEEDRDLAAAIRASQAVRRQEARGAFHERANQKPRKEEKMDTDELRSNRGAAKPSGDVQGRSMKNNVTMKGADFPVLGAGVNLPPPTPNTVKPSPVALKEDDFPSLVQSAGSAPVKPAYTAQTRKHSSFQEEDFPALVSKIRPQKPHGSTTSAWSQAGSTPVVPSTKPVVLPMKTAPAPTPVFSANDPPPSSSASQPPTSRRKKQLTSLETAKATPKVKRPVLSDDEDGGKTTMEIRAAPTMLEISSLLTVKPGPSQPNPKAGRKKKLANTPAGTSSHNGDLVTHVAHKENVPDTKPPDGSVPKVPVVPKANKIINGYKENATEVTSSSSTPEEPPAAKKQPVSDLTPAPEEDFPALITKKPPPGFKTAFPLKTTQSGLPPPPGLGPTVSKPPPGFTGVPLNSNVVEPTVPISNRPAPSLGTYHMPENFKERNMDLIQSIKNFLKNDESKFNEFRNYSGQFRQGVISAGQYHKSCQLLLGDSFNRVFNELLVLLPDTRKQQELLTAHADCKALETQQHGSKPPKNKKKAWQTNAFSSSLDLDCQVCPTCKQVLALKDFNTHKTLHIGEDDFPSLQDISKIIS